LFGRHGERAAQQDGESGLVVQPEDIVVDADVLLEAHDLSDSLEDVQHGGKSSCYLYEVNLYLQ